MFNVYFLLPILILSANRYFFIHIAVFLLLNVILLLMSTHFKYTHIALNYVTN